MAMSGESLRQRCAQEMQNPRGFAGCSWLYETFMEVPREHFVPDHFWWPVRGDDGLYRLYARQDTPRAWLKAVYLPGVYLITQLDDGAVRPTGPAEGAITSSISSPGVIVELVRHLAPEPGDAVLEIGTGTGYTTALLVHRAGAGGVVTMEIDDELAARARARLQARGMSPRVLVGDGEQGYADGGPYDRILATASVRRIPRAWLQQLRPGGVLVVPLATPFGHDLLVRLVADGQGGAEGVPVAPVEFMRVRSQRRSRPYTELGWPGGLAPAQWQQLRITAGQEEQRIAMHLGAAVLR